MCAGWSSIGIRGYASEPRVQNALQAIALSHGLRRGSSFWSETGQQAIASLSLTRYTAERRGVLQSLYRHLEEQIEELNRKAEEVAWQRPQGGGYWFYAGVYPPWFYQQDVYFIMGADGLWYAVAYGNPSLMFQVDID
jgi:hypothetical protein